MIERDDASSPLAPDLYSPRLRTALVLAGTGTAGAYHAGVLRALHEAGVKIDLVGARGAGVVGALFAAIDGDHRLWDERGFWRSGAARSFYRWRPVLAAGAWTLAAALALVLLPIAAAALGLIVFPIEFAMRLIGLGGVSGLAGAYLAFAQAAFAPEALPTWVPRLVLIVLAGFAIVLLVNGLPRDRRRRARGAFWWRAVPSPLTPDDVVAQTWRAMWDLVRGAAQLRQPPPGELARRYTELLAENLGQPGFRELVLVVHDLDARRDLVFALVAESRRRGLVRRTTSAAAESRRADVFDLNGVARDHLADAVAAALAIPLATAPHAITFAPESYWRGETHRLCDRPSALARLVDELASLGVEQVILVSADTESAGPHALGAPRLDGRGHIGEYLRAAEASAVRDASAPPRVPRLFTIRPAHNPVGPLDFAGGYDESSDRRQPLAELMSRGYEDAYHQFIEPVVGASGDRVGQGV